MLQEKESDVKEFNLQFFASEGEGKSEGKSEGDNSLEKKVAFDGKEYSTQEVKDAFLALENQKKWRKELAEKGEEINNQKRIIEAWQPIIEKYDQDDDFQKIFDKVIDEGDADFQKTIKQLVGLGTNGDEEDDVSVQTQKILKSQAEEIARLKEITSVLIESEKGKLMNMALEDKKNVEKAIQTNTDPFTIEDVEDLVEQQAITFSEAYDRLQLKNKKVYQEKYKQQAIKEIEEKYKNSVPDSSIPPGSGIADKKTNFSNFDDAAERIKKQGAGKLWK